MIGLERESFSRAASATATTEWSAKASAERRPIALASDQPFELFPRQRHTAGLSRSVRLVSVKVRASRDREPQTGRFVPVARRRGRVVIGVVHLERIEPGGSEFRQPVV